MRMPSTRLIDFLAEKQLPWLSLNPDSNRLEFVIDNYLLSMYRSCPAHFMLVAVEGYKKRGTVAGASERIWPLDFGTLFHKMMEEYYQIYKEPGFSLEDFAIKRALAHWSEMKMDVHLTNIECQSMGGYPGFAGMLVQYAKQFKAENEVLKVLASEVSFGKAKEVPIYEWETESESTVSNGELTSLWSPADIYLSGRMDIIADDGSYILPMDHKTISSFYKDPATWYSIDDGPCGYIYSLKKLLPQLGLPPELVLKRSCSRIMMNFISKKIPKEGSRFKRLVLFKGEEALEAYRVRVIGTCNNILNDLELYSRGLGVPRNTSICGNWFYRECQFADVHRQQDKAGELATLSNGFLKLPVWNTEEVKPLYEE